MYLPIPLHIQAFPRKEAGGRDPTNKSGPPVAPGYYAPTQGALSDDAVCLTSAAYIRSACAAGRLDGAYWLHDRARIGRSGSRLPLRASVACLAARLQLA